MSADVEAAIEETAARARTFLFNTEGKRRPKGYFIALYALQTVLRPASVAEVMQPNPDRPVFDLMGTTYLYDAELGKLLMEDALTSPFCDQVICNAAAAMLDATASIIHPGLRAYACGKLMGMTTGSDSKRKRGRSSDDYWGRDAVIIGRLIPPLLDRFNSTRNDATKHLESACSIVKAALERVGIHMSERRIEGIWEKYPHRPR